MTCRIRFSLSPFSMTCHRLSTATSRSQGRSSSLRARELLKDIVKPEKIPLEYWTRIILVAEELKKSLIENKKKCLHLLDTKHVTLLFVRPHGRFQLAFTLACDLLGARRTLYHDRNFENQPNPSDSANHLAAVKLTHPLCKVKETSRGLSKLTDMFVFHGLHHDVLIKMVSSAMVPVFSASSDAHCLQKALSDLMTFHEKLHRLKGLTVAWIGPPSSLFNSYMVLCSKFGINLQYTLICSVQKHSFEKNCCRPNSILEHGSGRMSPARRFERKNLQQEGSVTDIKEFKSVVETVTGAHIIATSMHPDESNRITMELLKNADPNYVFMHSLPRTWKEVSDDVFNQENNLSWETSENYLYVAMAFILTSLGDYEPKLSGTVL